MILVCTLPEPGVVNDRCRRAVRTLYRMHVLGGRPLHVVVTCPTHGTIHPTNTGPTEAHHAR